MNRFAFIRHVDHFVANGAVGHPRAQFLLRSLAMIVATIATISFARAADELPSQDQAIARALENHPDIVAAKAKLALAQAELYSKRIEVSRQVLALYGGLKTLDSQIDAAKASLKQAQSDFDHTRPLPVSGNVDQVTKDKNATLVQVAESKLVQATAQREQAERELQLTFGATSRPKEALSLNFTPVPSRKVPQGAIVDQWKVATDKPIKLSFAGNSLEEVLDFLSDKSGIMFSAQLPALESAGINVADPITLNTSNVPLRAALQGFEDRYPELQFVLRDYGILLTTKDFARQNGYTPALEIGNDPSGRR